MVGVAYLYVCTWGGVELNAVFCVRDNVNMKLTFLRKKIVKNKTDDELKIICLVNFLKKKNLYILTILLVAHATTGGFTSKRVSCRRLPPVFLRATMAPACCFPLQGRPKARIART